MMAGPPLTLLPTGNNHPERAGTAGVPGSVLFLGSGRCYHTMDWFRSAQALQPDRPPVLATDQLEGESFIRLVMPEDRVEPLVVIDGVLSRKQGRAGDIWRNFVKLLLLPVQALKLRQVLRRYDGPVVHAHSMYYVALARLARCRYAATPQGSELLVRPYRSRAYRWFAGFALGGAARITVDSEAMRRAAADLYGLDATLVQNGIDLEAIHRLGRAAPERDRIVSVRGLVPNYQIDRILEARRREVPGTPLTFCYPFQDEAYKSSLADGFRSGDQDLGRLPRDALYQLLLAARLVLSVPVSDSSPRSVYEAIFCGAIVATTPGAWIEALPACMRSRLVIVDPGRDAWLKEALVAADSLLRTPYVPSAQALAMYDQKASMRRFITDIYPAVACA
jgi:hypothetical protein